MLAYGANYDWYLDCMTKMGLKLAGKLIIGSDSNLGEEALLRYSIKRIDKKKWLSQTRLFYRIRNCFNEAVFYPVEPYIL